MPTQITEGPEPPESLRVHALNLLVLRCADLERSIRFYKALGLRFFRFRIGGTDSHGAKAIIPGPEFPLTRGETAQVPPCTHLELLAAGEQPTTRGVTFGLFVESVDASARAARNVEADVLLAPVTRGYGRVAVVADPDGNTVQLSESPLPEIAV
jgi:catechol 2,3-dioxygenase-like lactoylglutathione lyase family enzyme